MNREDELTNELLVTQTELGEVKGRLLIAEKEVADARVAVAGYLAELKRIATKTKEMLEAVAGIQKSGDAVRVRLGKVQKALKAADDYVNVLSEPMYGEVQIAPFREKYKESKEVLKTPDVVMG